MLDAETMDVNLQDSSWSNTQEKRFKNIRRGRLICLVKQRDILLLHRGADTWPEGLFLQLDGSLILSVR